MKKTDKKIRIEVCVIALFLVFVLIFSVFRTEIADCATWMLAMTHEISLSTVKESQAKAQVSTQQLPPSQLSEQQAPIKISVLTQDYPSKNKFAARVNPIVNKKADDVFAKPVTTNLPKTEIPSISFAAGIPDWLSAGGTLFPPLRKFDGTVWNEEKTEIKISTDGKKLYALFRLYDKSPREAISGDPKKRPGRGLWDTDSIEFFLMKNSKSEYYCQYIISVSGSGLTLYNKITDKPNVGQAAPQSKSFELPRFSAEEFDGGFDLEIRIALSNIDVETLNPGDNLLMQIVRNYRGQSEKKSVILQLFPVHIYGDNRLGASNNDRRAFQAIPVKRDILK